MGRILYLEKIVGVVYLEGIIGVEICSGCVCVFLSVCVFVWEIEREREVGRLIDREGKNVRDWFI